MALLTQKNAGYVFGLTFAWSSVLPMGLLPDNKWTHAITALLTGASVFLGYQGFAKTPMGNTLPPSVASIVDRQAMTDKAGDAVVGAVAASVTAQADKITEGTK